MKTVRGPCYVNYGSIGRAKIAVVGDSTSAALAYNWPRPAPSKRRRARQSARSYGRLDPASWYRETAPPAASPNRTHGSFLPCQSQRITICPPKSFPGNSLALSLVFDWVAGTCMVIPQGLGVMWFREPRPRHDLVNIWGRRWATSKATPTPQGPRHSP